MLIEGPQPKPTDTSQRDQQLTVDLDSRDDSVTSGVLLLGMIELDILPVDDVVHIVAEAYAGSSTGSGLAWADPGLIPDEDYMSCFLGGTEHLVKIAQMIK